ncbi:MAG: hypothetical protein ABJ034_08450 [Hyphomicrobiales bacterium]
MKFDKSELEAFYRGMRWKTQRLHKGSFDDAIKALVMIMVMIEGVLKQTTYLKTRI